MPLKHVYVWNMTRLLTINDIIHTYFAYYSNGDIQSSLYQRETMMREMNEIKEDYNNIGGTWPDGTKITLELVLRKCVRGIYSRGHQYCIDVNAVNKAINNLLTGTYGVNKKFVSGKNINEDFQDFEELYEAVKSLIKISGIGEVTIYDTARRIGHILKAPIYPQQYVYLTARKVKNAGSFIVGKEVNYREPATLFLPHFGTLQPLFIEDILCIFSEWFWCYKDIHSRPPYPKREKRIGWPWWSITVETFRNKVLDDIHKEDCKCHRRWSEFPMIYYPPLLVSKQNNKNSFTPCNRSVCKYYPTL